MSAQALTELDARLGARLRQARHNVPLTQDEVAAIIKVDRSTLAKWERGQRRLTAYDLFKMAALYRVPITVLVDLHGQLPLPGTPAVVAPTDAASIAPSLEHALELIRRLLGERPELLAPLLAQIEHLALASGEAQAAGAVPPHNAPALELLQGLDITHTAPLDALNLLAELQRQLRASPC